MDYEKEYREALERARKIHAEIVNNEVIGFPGQITDIFPELKESEDDRIRRELITALKDLDRNRLPVDPYPYLEWAKWLEKQKENPKSADSIPSDCTSDAKYEDRSSKYGVSPEDVLVVARACEKLEAHGYKELAHALKNVNLYTEEQKSTRWSEEDENALKYLHELISFGFAENFFDAQTAADMREWVNKSLRPSWKPSEEQMKILKSTVTYIQNKWTGAKVREQLTLESLYNDLKKL